MKLFLLLYFLFVSLILSAQDSWKVIHNEIEILNTGKHDPQQNILLIKESELVKPGIFELQYKEATVQKNWNRYLVAFDGAENVLLEMKGETVLKISNETLKSWVTKNSIIKIFTWSLPTDPELAARIRVRRLHLCTVELK